jgi:hypothetical protein
MADTPTQDTDYDATLADVRRSLEDLLAFEGRYFVVPEEASTPDVAVTPVVDGDDLDLFRQNISDCLNCQLGHTRKNFVFGSGNRDADIMQHLIEALVEIVAGRSCQRRCRDEQTVLLRSLTLPHAHQLSSSVRVIDTPKLETRCTAMQSNSSINQRFSTGC